MYSDQLFRIGAASSGYSARLEDYLITKQGYSNILKILPQKMTIFRQKFRYFSYFCSKYRLWAHIRTASPVLVRTALGGSNEYPHLCFEQK